MATTSDAGRHLRADAQENYERILAAATTVLARDGGDAPLTTIAAEAGVGIGTLYRRFPTREHLMEAVHRNKVIELSETAPRVLAGTTSAVTAMRMWADGFVELLIESRGVTAAIRPLLAPGSAFRTDTRESLTEAIALILERGSQTQTLRGDVDPIDILRFLTGIAYVSQSIDDARVPIDLFVDGLAYVHERPRPAQR